MIFRRWSTWYLAFFILAATLIGGGTEKGLPSTFAIELLALPLIFLGHPGTAANSAGRIWITGVAALLLALFAVQLLPVGEGAVLPADAFPDGGRGLALSGDMGRTLDSLAFVVCALIAFFAILSRTEAERNTVFATMSLGLIANMVLALVQFAANQLEFDIAGYAMRAGTFANPNHFSTLLFVSIPYWVYHFSFGWRRYLVLLPLAVILFIEFAARSTAGIGLAIAAALISLAWIWRPRFHVRIGLTVAIIGCAGLVALNAGTLIREEISNPLNRLVFASNTIEASADAMPLGTGFGTFPTVYPRYEGRTGIFAQFVNHAHDDFLELVLEGGLPVVAVLLSYAGLLVWSVLRYGLDPLRIACLLGICFILLHSLVDYPLRTWAIVAVFAFANAVLLSSPERPAARPRLRSGQ